MGLRADMATAQRTEGNAGSVARGPSYKTPSQRQVAQLGTLLDEFSDGAFAVGPEGRIVLWNAGAERILGYAARDILGKTCRDVLAGGVTGAGERCDHGCPVIAATIAAERLPSFSMRARAKSGETVWLNISVIAAGAPDGASLTAHLFQDATETRRLAAMIRRVPAGPRTPVKAASGVTRREIELLILLAGGASTKAIADRLCVSRNTVRCHLQNIFAKLDVHSRVEAVAWAHRHPQICAENGDLP